MLTRDEARAYFAACGLNYKDITLHELRYLEIELNGRNFLGRADEWNCSRKALSMPSGIIFVLSYRH